jgi:hypothetical protein
MRARLIALSATLGLVGLFSAALLWPKNEVQAQIGLPVGVADCSCTKGTQLDAGASRVHVYICQCGAQQCVISAGTTASGSAVPQLAQTCR